MSIENLRLEVSLRMAQSKNAELEKSLAETKEASQQVEVKLSKSQEHATKKLGMFSLLSPLTS